MYSFTSRVRYSECDAAGRLSPIAMLNYLQDCSTFQSESLGVGIRYLADNRMGWVLMSWLIEVERMPEFGEDITTSTWCYQIRGFKAGRNFKIADAEGRTLVAANSQWCLYDLAEHKMMRIPESDSCYLEDTPALEMGELPRRIPCEGEARDAAPVTVTDLHLDTNGHVNNAQYVSMALSAVDQLDGARDIASLCVQYRSMAWLGDVIIPHVHTIDAGHVVDLASPAGETYAIVRVCGR